MVTSLKKSLVCTATLSAPNPAAGQLQLRPLPETPGHTGKSGTVSRGVTAPFSWAMVCTSFCCALQGSISQSVVSSGSSMVG